MANPGSWSIFGKRLPDFGITEKIQSVIKPSTQRTAQGGSNLFGRTPTSYGQVLSATNQSYNTYPSSGYTSPIGPSYSGSTSGSTGSTGTASGTTTGDTSGGQYGSDLQRYYDEMKSIYESQFPGLEQDYNRGVGDVNAAVERARGTKDTQIQDVNVGYGEGLRNLLTSDRELGQKSRNLYAGLNALDSSSFAEAENKRGQQLFDTQSKLGMQKERDTKDINDQYGAYERQATGVLADLGSQYMSAKSALQQAIAQNNIEEAQSIQNYMQQIQSTVGNLKMNLASLQAQGTDVIGNLQKLNRGGIDNILGGYMSSYYQPTLSSMNTTSPGMTSMQGYISPRTGQRYNSYDDYLRTEGRA